jgi:hypothetical protein
MSMLRSSTLSEIGKSSSFGSKIKTIIREKMNVLSRETIEKYVVKKDIRKLSRVEYLQFMNVNNISADQDSELFSDDDYN